MSETLTYRSMQESDWPAVTRLIVHAFAGTPEGTHDWLKFAGPEHVRVVQGETHGRAAGRACLLRVPMGQFFGGRSVPMLGIAGVGVAPEVRGRGVAKFMMQEAVREAARDGYALSVLYPSTQSLYRAAGYEQAGHRLAVRLPVASIDVREKETEIAPLGDEDWPAVKACYAAYAPRFDGMVDRGPYIWGRVAKWHDQKFNGFGVRGPGGELEGYVFVAQKRKDTMRQELAVQDLVFLTPRAGRRILAFLAEFGTMGDDAVFAAGPSHPLLMMLGLQKYKLEFNYYWMLRVLDAAKALEGRGYPAGVRAEVHLEVEDEVLPANSGRWLLKVEDGRGRVARGGFGRVRTSARGLAAMYTGHMAPAALAMAGMAMGEESALREAGLVFGAMPWMTDFF